MGLNKYEPSEEETKIKLNKEDCALVIREDGKIDLFIPTDKEDGPISMGVFFISALAIALQTGDEEILELLSKKMMQRAKETEGNDKCQ